MSKYIILLLTSIAILFTGCTMESLGDSTVSIQPDTTAIPGHLIPYGTPSPSAFAMPINPTPESSAVLPIGTTEPEQKTEPTETPTPQIIEEIVEVIREVPVELPPKTVEIVKPVYVNTPLDGMDMRERQLSFRDEMNTRYNDVFDLTIAGGEYCYGFTNHTEYLIGYHFVDENGEVVFSRRFPPLSADADQATLDAIMQELQNVLETEGNDENAQYYDN